MADEASQQPIVIKKIKKVVGGGHGGAWKIAYADFVTAMMAFFLLMWLLGSVDGGKLVGIAEYFKTPLQVAMGNPGTGDTSNIIQGGGKDLSRQTGQVQQGAVANITKNMTPESAAGAKGARQEMIQLTQLKDKIEKAIESNPTLHKFKKQLLLDLTTEGLRIQIVDAQNRPMFSSGSADVQPYTRTILHEIGQTLNDVPNKISLAGHTDATPFPPGHTGYSNWELSADRANASRRELIAGNMDPRKVLRVVGLSSAVPFDKNKPYSPINRRITITVMNKKAEQAVTSDGGNKELTFNTGL